MFHQWPRGGCPQKANTGTVWLLAFSRGPVPACVSGKSALRTDDPRRSKHRSSPVFALGGLDCHNSCAVCVRRGCENRIADRRRPNNAPQRSHRGSAIVHCPDDGLGQIAIAAICHRQMSRHVLLYTEMVTAPAIVHGDRDRLLGFHDSEQPVALQLGGSDPLQLAEAARIAEDYGYVEVNLNCGCPSDRVQSGSFGAILMEKSCVGCKVRCGDD